MYDHKKIFIFALLYFTSCASKTINLATTSDENGDIVILATTDFHSTLERAEGLYNEVKKLRAKYGSKTVHLDGGDLFQGSLEGNMSKGKAIVEFYNLLEPDAAAIGNHELDYGPDVPDRSDVRTGEDGLGNLRRRVKEAKFPWLSANFITDTKQACKPDKDEYCNANGRKTVFKPHLILDRGILNKNKICIIGGTTPTTPRITQAAFIKGTSFEPLRETVLSEVDYLQKQVKCDFIILMFHAGLVCDQHENCKEPGDMAEILNLLNSLPSGFVDAVVAGHTHQRAQEIVNGVPVIESGCYGKQVGVLHLYKSRKKAPKFDPWYMVSDGAQAPLVSRVLTPFREAAHEIKSREVGFANGDFIRNYLKENVLGNFIADVVLAEGKKKANAHFALLNAGGVRNDLKEGAVTYGDLFKVYPFDNSLTIVKLKGAELRLLLEIALSGGNGMPPFAGFTVKMLDVKPSQKGRWDRDLNGDGKTEVWERDILIEIIDSNGNPIEEDKEYVLASIDFLAMGAERQERVYSKLQTDRLKIYTGYWIRDILEKYLKEKKSIDPTDYFNPELPRATLVAP